MYKIIYPETRYVTEAQIRTWLADGIANEEVDDIGLTVEDAKTVSIELAMELISNAGFVTFTSEV